MLKVPCLCNRYNMMYGRYQERFMPKSSTTKAVLLHKGHMFIFVCYVSI